MKLEVSADIVFILFCRSKRTTACLRDRHTVCASVSPT